MLAVSDREWQTVLSRTGSCPESAVVGPLLYLRRPMKLRRAVPEIWLEYIYKKEI